MPFHAGATLTGDPVSQTSDTQPPDWTQTGSPRSEPLDSEEISRVAAATEVASYQWNIATDELRWSANAATVLGCDHAALHSGRHYASLLHAKSPSSRFDAVLRTDQHDTGGGVPFQVEYRLKDWETREDGGKWIEDKGRWHGDEHGRPAMVMGVVRRIDDRRERDERLNYLSHTDALTGMMNRSRMNEVLGEAIGVLSGEGQPCTFAIAAIRNLDVVNEAYGFEVADEVIAAVGKKLRGVMRTGDGIARYSGSKFGIILNSCMEDDVEIALERFLQAARDSVIETSLGPVWALMAIGAVSLAAPVEKPGAVIARAEEALSLALRQPGDSHVTFRGMDGQQTERLLNAKCAAEIVGCLKNSVFRLAFQPIVSAKTGETMMHEALLRLEDSAGELVAAAHLVPVAERLGLIRLIDRSIVQLALQKLHRFSDARLSINISPTTASDPRWNRQLLDMLKAAPALCNRLTIEINESAILGNRHGAVAFMEKLRETGCCIAIDNYGAGFTSFRSLSDFPIDLVKLDGSYCKNLATAKETAWLAKTLIDLAHRLGIKAAAERVESAEDAAILIEMGIDFLQGHHFGKPAMTTPWLENEASAFVFSHPGETTAAVHTSNTATDLDEVDQGLLKLREAINQLTGHFGQRESETELTRIAS